MSWFTQEELNGQAPAPEVAVPPAAPTTGWFTQEELGTSPADVPTSSTPAVEIDPFYWAPEYEKDSTAKPDTSKYSNSVDNPLLVSRYRPSDPRSEDDASLRPEVDKPEGLDDYTLEKFFAPAVNLPMQLYSGAASLKDAAQVLSHEYSKIQARRSGDTAALQRLLDSENASGISKAIEENRMSREWRLGGYDPNSMGEIIPSAIGQTIGFAIPTAVAAYLGAPTAVGLGITATLGAGVGAAGGIEDARDNKATEDEVYRSAMWNAAFGLTEAAPLGKLAKRINDATNGVFTSTFIKNMDEITKGKFRVPEVFDSMITDVQKTAIVTKEAIQGAIEETIQEMLQTGGLNLNAQLTYDPARSITENLAASGGAGASIGFLLSALGANMGVNRFNKQRGLFEKQRTEVEEYVQSQIEELDVEGIDTTAASIDDPETQRQNRIRILGEKWDAGLMDTVVQRMGEEGSALSIEQQIAASQTNLKQAGIEASRAIDNPEVALQIEALRKEIGDPTAALGSMAQSVVLSDVDATQRVPNLANDIGTHLSQLEATGAPGVVVGAFSGLNTQSRILQDVADPKAALFGGNAAVRDLTKTFRGIVTKFQPLLANTMTGAIPNIVLLEESDPNTRGRAGLIPGRANVFGIKLYTKHLAEAAAERASVFADPNSTPEDKQFAGRAYKMHLARVLETLGHEISHVMFFQRFDEISHMDRGGKILDLDRYNEEYQQILDRKHQSLSDLNRAATTLAYQGNQADDEYAIELEKVAEQQELETRATRELTSKYEYQAYKSLKNLYDKYLVDMAAKGKTVQDFQRASGGMGDIGGLLWGGTISDDVDLDLILSAKGTRLSLSNFGKSGAKNIAYWQNFHEFVARLLSNQIYHNLGDTPTGNKILDDILRTQKEVYKELSLIPEFREFRSPVGEYIKQLSLTNQLTKVINKRLEGTMSGVEAVMRLNPETGKMSGSTKSQNVRVLPAAESQAPPSNDPANPSPPNNSEATVGDYENWNTGQDKFNKFYSWGIGVLHLAQMNEHIPAIQNYVQILRNWANERGKRIFEAQNIHTAWRRLGKEQANKLSKVMLEESIAGEFKTAEELFKDLDDEGLAVRERLQGYYAEILKAMETTLVTAAMKKYQADPFAQDVKLQEISDRFAELRGKPYFPLMRFGKFAIQIRSAEGKQIYFESFESPRERDQALAEWQRRRDQTVAATSLKGAKVKALDMTDEMLAVQGMPIDFAKLYVERLKEANVGITDEQLKILEDLSFNTSQAKGFMKQFKKRRVVPGYSTDGLRVFSAYAISASNHIARVQHAPALAEQISLLRQQTTDTRKRAPESVSTVKRDQMANWVEEHFKYLLNPESEWVGLRSAAFAWFLGFNLKTAILNTSQLPMITYPHLAGKYGDTKAVAAMAKAAKDVGIYVTKGAAALSPGAMKMLIHGKAAGWLDEGMTTELAMSSREHRMDRMHPGNMTKRFIQKIPQYSAVFFHTAEKLNRHVTALAAYDLAMAAGKSQQEAEFLAETAIERTQFIYDRWNRAPLFRGKKGVALIFMSYAQNVLVFAMQDAGARRWWAMQLIVGGLVGLPFADDIMDLMSTFWNWWQKFFNTQKPFKDFKIELRRQLQATVGEIGLNPDLLMHGISRESFGLTSLPILESFPLPRIDLSGSMGMGNILPLTEDLKALSAGQDLNDFLARGGENVGGAAVAGTMSIIRAMASNDPDHWRRWEKALPTSLHSASQSLRMGVEGQLTTQRGDVVAEFDPNDTRDRIELLMKAFSFQPTKITEGWELEIAQREAAQGYRIRKAKLLTDLNWARSRADREGISDALDDIQKYNANVPFPEMGISGKERMNSWRSYKKIHQKAGSNVAMERDYRRLENELQGIFDPIEEEGSEGSTEEAVVSGGSSNN